MLVPLNESATVVLNGSGNGSAKVGPISAREVWSPDNVHVSASSNTNEAVCKIYVGDSAIQRNYRDGTFTGSTGDSTDKVNADTVKVGAYIWGVWTGGDAGATATLTITGKKQL
jgi:hypothetical protein